MKKISADSFLQYQYTSNPRFSPNGKYVAFISMQANYEGNGYKGDIYIIEDGVSRRLTGMGDAKTFCWTPDNALLFPAMRCPKLKKRAEQGEVLTPYYEIGVNGGEAKLAFTLPIAASELTYLGGDLYSFIGEYIKNGPQTAEERKALAEKEAVYNTFDELPFLKSNQGIANGKRNRLYMYNRKTGDISPVSGEDQMVTKVSHSGTKLVYAAAGFTNTVLDSDVAIYTYDAVTGKSDCVMKADQLMVRHQEVFAQIWGDKIIVFGSKGETYGRTESPTAWLIDSKTKEMTLFFKHEYNVSYRSLITDSQMGGNQNMKAVGDRLYFTTCVGVNNYVQYIDKNGNWSEFLTPDGSVDGFDVFDGRLVYCGFFNMKLSEIYENGKQLSHQNDAFFAEHSVSMPKYCSFTNSEGLEIDGWVLEPVGYEPGKKYPAILDIHGGPRCTFGTIYFHEHQMWANDGYFVMICNPRGSEGKGDAFADVWGKMGTIDYKDLMEFADHALATHPDIDQKRVGVTGGSYGGYMTNWIVGHTNRFAAACSQRSITNWISFEYATSIGFYWSKDFNRYSTSENVEYLWDISPLKYAPNCKTPILFINSDSDNVCWMAEGIQMYSAVKMAGVPAKLCLFKGEGHELSRAGRPQPRLGRLTEMNAWMNKYLK